MACIGSDDDDMQQTKHAPINELDIAGLDANKSELESSPITTRHVQRQNADIKSDLEGDTTTRMQLTAASVLAVSDNDVNAQFLEPDDVNEVLKTAYNQTEICISKDDKLRDLHCNVIRRLSNEIMSNNNNHKPFTIATNPNVVIEALKTNKDSEVIDNDHLDIPDSSGHIEHDTKTSHSQFTLVIPANDQFVPTAPKAVAPGFSKKEADCNS